MVMPELDPDAAALLTVSPPFPINEQSLERVRALLESAPQPPAPAIGRAEDQTIAGPHGPLAIRLYRPIDTRPDEQLPTLVYFHGGGMVMGSVDSFDAFARRLCHGCHALVVSVDYRLAPEHQYPVANDECYAATLWAAGISHRRGGLAVAGDSAGGSLAAAVALRAAAHDGPELALQILLYPGLERASVPRASMAAYAEGPALTRTDITWMKAQYLGVNESSDTEYMTPALAEELAGLPPTIVVTAEIDPARDGGEAFGERLRAEGVPTALLRYPGVAHGFMMQAGWIARGDRAFAEVCALARTHLHPPGEELPPHSALPTDDPPTR